jgi:hypothetical protein
VAEGYEVYVTLGRRAVVGVDSPAATVSTAELSAEIDAGTLGLTPNADYCVEVYAFNATGRSTAAETWVHVDAEGVPQIVPTPVAGLDVTPLAGGQVLVEWSYSESNEAAVADEFLLTYTPAGGAAVEVSVANEGQGEFSETITPGGTWVRVSVQSRRDDAGAGYVPAVECLVDATEPAAGIAGATVG